MVLPVVFPVCSADEASTWTVLQDVIHWIQGFPGLVVVHGDEQVLEQIEKQVRKLEDVIYVTDLTAVDSVCRELMLVKVRVLPENRQSIMAVSSIFHGKVVDVTRDSMIIELTGKQEKLDAFINLLDGYEILEVASTGLTGLERGSECVVPLKGKSL